MEFKQLERGQNKEKRNLTKILFIEAGDSEGLEFNGSRDKVNL